MCTQMPSAIVTFCFCSHVQWGDKLCRPAHGCPGECDVWHPCFPLTLSWQPCIDVCSGGRGCDYTLFVCGTFAVPVVLIWMLSKILWSGLWMEGCVCGGEGINQNTRSFRRSGRVSSCRSWHRHSMLLTITITVMRFCDSCCPQKRKTREPTSSLHLSPVVTFTTMTSPFVSWRICEFWELDPCDPDCECKRRMVHVIYKQKLCLK